MSKAQIIINLWVWILTLYSPWKISNPNQRGAQITDLSVMISRCPLMGDMINILQMLAVLISGRQRLKQQFKWEKWTREDNKSVIHCYFKSNPVQRCHIKRMSEIWVEPAKFKTSPRFIDQARIILKKSWFSDLEILKIFGHLSCEVYEQSPLLELKCKILKTKTLHNRHHNINVNTRRGKNVELIKNMTEKRPLCHHSAIHTGKKSR